MLFHPSYFRQAKPKNQHKFIFRRSSLKTHLKKFVPKERNSKTEITNRHQFKDLIIVVLRFIQTPFYSNL